MTIRPEAIFVIVQDGRSTRGSITAAKRVIRACRTLALTDNETIAVLCGLEYCDSDGVPFDPYKAQWPLLKARPA